MVRCSESKISRRHFGGRATKLQAPGSFQTRDYKSHSSRHPPADPREVDPAKPDPGLRRDYGGGEELVIDIVPFTASDVF